MDLQLQGRWALVCGASQGLGRGCAEALAAEGVNLVLTARGEAALAEAVAQIAAAHPAITVRGAAGDIATPEGRVAALAAVPQLDILVNNAGGPPPGDFRDWDREVWLRALEANMLAPIELMRASVDAMARRGYGRVINITSGAVKAPIDTLGLSNGARSGLTGFVAGLARQPGLAGRGVTINNLLPGSFDTARLRKNFAIAAERSGRDAQAIAEARAATVPAGRFGTPAEFGAFCAFLCSPLAGYITGQNLLIDGGAYPGTF